MSLFQKAQSAQQSGNLAEAEQLCRAAIAAPGDHEGARRMLAMLLVQRGDYIEAEVHVARAAQMSPGDIALHQNHAQLLAGIGRTADAIAAATRAINLKPDFAPGYVSRGHAKAQGGDPTAAIIDYKKAVSLGRFGDPSLFFGLGHALAQIGERDEALEAYARVIKIKPDFSEAVANRGAILLELGRGEEALAHAERALALNPNGAENHNLRGNALAILHRLNEAALAFQQALSLRPENAATWRNFGNVLNTAGQPEKAVAAYDRALALNPGLPFVRDMRLHAALHLCDWTNFDAQCQDLFADIEQGRVVQPFALASLPCSPALRLKAAQTLAAARFPPQTPLRATAPRKPGRLRIAYVGAMFRDHPVSLLMAGVLENHNREDFEFFGICHGQDDHSAVRARMAKALEHFIDMRADSDRAIAERIAALGIDIAIDLDGYTEDARPVILSYRPAPMQAQFLGYPGTMGASHIDYLIGDDIVTPPEHQTFYSEKLVRLPVAYLPNVPRPAPAQLTRADFGLPPDAILFCAFTQPYKISPDTFAAWMRILARVPGSLLWLRDGADITKRNLSNAAQSHGVDPARLIFAGPVEADAYFARLALSDLYLDTFIYGAHTTAGDVLWAGTPLVTILGDAFPARVASSLLSQAGLGELIAADASAYEELAVALASDPARRTSLRAHLQQNQARIFNAASFAGHLEAAYRQIAAPQT